MYTSLILILFPHFTPVPPNWSDVFGSPFVKKKQICLNWFCWMFWSKWIDFLKMVNNGIGWIDTCYNMINIGSENDNTLWWTLNVEIMTFCEYILYFIIPLFCIYCVFIVLGKQKTLFRKKRKKRKGTPNIRVSAPNVIFLNYSGKVVLPKISDWIS